MGARQSTDEDKGAAEKVFDTDQIYYDADGNLRLGASLDTPWANHTWDECLHLNVPMRLPIVPVGASLRDKELELKKVADADDPDDKVRNVRRFE